MPSPRVLFLLGNFCGVPFGGYKMIYQYANGLAAAGFSVTLAYAAYPHEKTLRGRAYDVLRTGYHWIRGWTRHCPWFPLDPSIRQILRWTHREALEPRADIAIATACRTAAPLAAFKQIPPQRKFYFIQGFETFTLPEPELRATFRLPMQKLVIASWLRAKVEEEGQSAILLPNGYDGSFQLSRPPADRPQASVCALYGEGWSKDWPTTLQTLLLLRRARPDIQATVFGIGARPPGLPAWATYVRRATVAQLNEIYNSSAIFLGTSVQEGWGLPVGEAMRCGAAVVCTDNGGYAEMAIPGQTALVVPARNPDTLAAAALRLVEHPDLRIRLAMAGHAHIQQFSLQRSIDQLATLLRNSLIETRGCNPG
ncbi:MAG: glycosyltransferase family 4 protein [Kiritimatiellae bacterium]|nr:glycosyltransferase family 4 protein [Kiritimatiellia bacterium]